MGCLYTTVIRLSEEWSKVSQKALTLSQADTSRHRTSESHCKCF